MIRRIRLRRVATPLLAALASGLLCGLLYGESEQSASLTALEGELLDWRFQLRGPRPVGDDIVVVAVDERSISAIGAWPLSHSMLAAAIERIGKAGARVVAIDLLVYPGTTRMPDGETAPAVPRLDGIARRLAGDAPTAARGGRLTRAFAATRGLVAPFAFDFAQSDVTATVLPEVMRHAAIRVSRGHARDEALVPRAAGLLQVSPLLQRVGAIGHVNVLLDADGSLRHSLPVVAYGDAVYPSFALEIARLAKGLSPEAVVLEFGKHIQIGRQYIELTPDSRIAVDYPGTDAFPVVPLVDLLEGRVDPSRLAGRVVILGVTAAGVGDNFATPYSHTLPGVLHHAAVVENLLSGRPLVRSAATQAADMAMILLCALLAATLASGRTPLGAWATTLLVAAGSWTVAYLAFAETGLWLNMVLPAMAVLLAGLLVIVAQTMADRVSRRRAERHVAALSRYLPATLSDSLASGARWLRTDRTQTAAVMFVDIVGFTRLGESLPAGETLQLLREYHARAEQAVAAHGGMLDKFIGDGVMAVFGVPEPRDDDALRALACAGALAADIAAWSRRRAAAGAVPVRIGIGLHYGEVIAGEVGGDRHAQFTLTGDTVNVANRLEGMTRDNGVTILASDAIVAAARAAGGGEPLRHLRRLAPMTVRGRNAPIVAWAWEPAPLTA